MLNDKTKIKKKFKILYLCNILNEKMIEGFKVQDQNKNLCINILNQNINFVLLTKEEQNNKAILYAIPNAYEKHNINATDIYSYICNFVLIDNNLY